MRRLVFLVIAALATIVAPAERAPAGETLVDTVVEGCKVELESYCKDVTPGEGRMLACLYAFQDKLSGQCEFALYDAAAQLERAIAALTYLINECRDDANVQCAGVRVGEGRVIKCLNDNAAKISGRCSRALADLGLDQGTN